MHAALMCLRVVHAPSIEYLATMTDAVTDLDAAIDALLAEHDPTSMSTIEFRGHQYDCGLGVVHFPQGHGGLGLAPSFSDMSRSGSWRPVVPRRIHEASSVISPDRRFSPMGQRT